MDFEAKFGQNRPLIVNREICADFKPPIQQKSIRHIAYVYSTIFRANFKESNFRIIRSHLHGAGGQVQQGHGCGHHVGGGEFIFHNAHVLTLICQAKSTEDIFRHLPIHLHIEGGQVQ